MKCLEKDRTRRYGTAIEPALDIERHLRNEPVAARPPSRVYQFQKLVRRNKLAFAAAGAVAVALIIGIGLSTWLYIRERSPLRVAAENARLATKQAEATALSAKSEAEQRIRTEIEKAELIFADDDAPRALAYLARITGGSVSWQHHRLSMATR
jgi:hypothetical protein